MEQLMEDDWIALFSEPHKCTIDYKFYMRWRKMRGLDKIKLNAWKLYELERNMRPQISRKALQICRRKFKEAKNNLWDYLFTK